jgi:hypothetical protein
MDPKELAPISAWARNSERRPHPRVWRRAVAPVLAWGTIVIAIGFEAGLTVADVEPADRPVDPRTFVDHDAYPPIPQPAEHEADLYKYYVRYGFVQPLADALDLPGAILHLAGAENEAANINDFDEAPNSSWFTNRNHFRAVPVEEIRVGPGNCRRPVAPFTITAMKKSGVNAGFNIKDAAGEDWVVKLDPPGYPQIASGADVVVSRLLYAAGYNVPHDVALIFTRAELGIDPELAAGKDGEPPVTVQDLDQVLDHGDQPPADGRYFALASLILSGTSLGHVDMARRRADDPNDWYNHRNRRELRGLLILAAWFNSWDVKDHQSLEMFETQTDSLGAIRHYLIDFGATLGAAAEGPKRLKEAYEFVFDPGWIARRWITFGFIQEPWREAAQATGIPSVGNFAAEDFDPDDFRPTIPHLAFQELTPADGYWGAKVVASFSDAQIAAAVEAAGYEDPRAAAYITAALELRRNAIAKTWFDRVAPIDFLRVENGQLVFNDLAVDLGLEAPRSYEVEIAALAGDGAPPEPQVVAADGLDLSRLGPELTALRVVIGIEGSAARPTTAELHKQEGQEGKWRITRVRHGR